MAAKKLYRAISVSNAPETDETFSLLLKEVQQRRKLSLYGERETFVSPRKLTVLLQMSTRNWDCQSKMKTVWRQPHLFSGGNVTSRYPLLSVRSQKTVASDRNGQFRVSIDRDPLINSFNKLDWLKLLICCPLILPEILTSIIGMT